jgi:hypothetical protein
LNLDMAVLQYMHGRDAVGVNRWCNIDAAYKRKKRDLKVLSKVVLVLIQI